VAGDATTKIVFILIRRHRVNNAQRWRDIKRNRIFGERRGACRDRKSMVGRLCGAVWRRSTVGDRRRIVWLASAGAVVARSSWRKTCGGIAAKNFIRRLMRMAPSAAS
jgi:hypothetical protein